MKDKILESIQGALFGLGSAVFVMVCVVIVLFLAVEAVKLYAVL